MALSGTFGIIVAVVGYVVWWRKRALDRWRDLAREVGLEMCHERFFHHPELSGTYRDHQVRVYTFAKGGRRGHVYTTLHVSLNHPLGLGLRVRREGVSAKVDKTLGVRDIETGDPGLDRVAMIEGGEPDRVRQLLTPELRRALCEILEREPSTELDDRGISITVRGLIADKRRIERLLDELMHICSQVKNGCHQVGMIEGRC